MKQIHIPRVYSDVSSSRLLVMEWIEGDSVRDAARLDALGLDRNELADILLHGALKQMLIDGHFHADPHPGNVMMLDDGRVGLIDFGATGRLAPWSSRPQADDGGHKGTRSRAPAPVSARGRNASSWVRRRSAGARAQPLHGSTSGPGRDSLSRHVERVAEAFFSFGITLPPEFSTMFRALITLEGTLRILTPGYLVIESAQQVAAEWARERLSPTTLHELARKGGHRSVAVAPARPEAP